MPRHVSRYRVQLYDVNAFGELGAATVLRFMQQTASDASAAAGFDVEWYADHGTIWLIRRSTVEYVTPAIYRDELAVHTWVSDIRRVRSRREYELRRIGDDTLIARGVSDWVYVDTASGKPVRAPEELQRGLMPGGVVAQERRPQKPALPPPNAFRTARRVEFAAIDSVVHVNNAHYAVYLEQDLWDALAAHGWTLSPVTSDGLLRARVYDIEYFDAAVYGDQLTDLVWVTNVAADGFRCEHTLERDGRRLLHAVSEWRWAAGALPPALQRAAHALAIV
ncbi:MAG: thioesterase family protein [Deltaproteobacteria bacterium]|nr:thioesterase family protein [Deltaproteobacteria bacterium]MBI3388235.1 thioesterase family protein [Deltaproteobacteria bacterium]